jgi:capsular polysaccharide biosynthesis protein
VGTLICGLAAALISLNMPKIYRINTIIRPGVMKVDEDGHEIYSDSPFNIKLMIESGVSNTEIINNLKNTKVKDLPNSIHIKAEIAKGADIINIYYDTAVTDQGIKILDQLIKSLEKQYSELLQKNQKEYEKQILFVQKTLLLLEQEENIANISIDNFAKRIKDLKHALDLLNMKKNYYEKESPEPLKLEHNNDFLRFFLQEDVVNKNLELRSKYEDQILDYMLKKRNVELNLKEIQRNLELEAIRLERLKIDKNSMKAIEILQDPTRSDYSIKPRIRLNITLAIVGGLFINVFLAFFVDYIVRHRRKTEG